MNDNLNTPQQNTEQVNNEQQENNKKKKTEKSNKIVLGIIAAIIILLAGAGIFFFKDKLFSKNENKPVNTPTQNETNKNDNTEKEDNNENNNEGIIDDNIDDSDDDQYEEAMKLIKDSTLENAGFNYYPNVVFSTDTKDYITDAINKSATQGGMNISLKFPKIKTDSENAKNFYNKMYNENKKDIDVVTKSISKKEYDGESIYDISYSSLLYDDILIITIKKMGGGRAEGYGFQIPYYYDIKEDKEMTLSEFYDKLNISVNDVNKMINYLNKNKYWEKASFFGKDPGIKETSQPTYKVIPYERYSEGIDSFAINFSDDDDTFTLRIFK